MFLISVSPHRHNVLHHLINQVLLSPVLHYAKINYHENKPNFCFVSIYAATLPLQNQFPTSCELPGQLKVNKSNKVVTEGLVCVKRKRTSWDKMRKLHCYSDGQHSSALIMQRLNETFMKYCTTDSMQAGTHVQRTWCKQSLDEV